MTARTVNIRQAQDFHPHVSIGQSKAFNPRPVIGLPGLRSSATIFADRDAARTELNALEADRADLMLAGTTDDLLRHDDRIARAKVAIDLAEVQHAAAVAREAEDRAAHEAEQARRKALHRQATKASNEVAKLAEQYVAEAQRLVPLLAKIRERALLVKQANSALPDGADPVPPGEPRCSWNGSPDQPHCPVSERVRLPALGNTDTPIWAPLPYR